MRSFYYRSGRSALAALFMSLLALGVGKLWYGDGSVMLLAFALLMAAGAAKAGFDAMSSEPALKFDSHSIWVRRTWGGTEEVPWRDVHDISAKVFTIRYMGVIPIGRTAYITVTCEGGAFGARRLRVSATAMGLSPAQSAELLLVLKKAHLDAVGEVGVAMAGAGSRGWGVGNSKIGGEREEASLGFDADAAVARYLAAKQAETQPQATAAAGGTQSSAAVRPVFGRRVS